MTIYHEFDKRLANSDRAIIIRNGWGETTPAKSTKHTKVQVLELTEAEAAEWHAAYDRLMANLFAPWSRR
jgi:hypothetical protein